MSPEWISAAGVLPAVVIETQRLQPGAATISAVQPMQLDNSCEIRVGPILRVLLPPCNVSSVLSIEPDDQIKLAPPPSSATLLQPFSKST